MNEKKPFWTSLPGILTGIAAVITAVGGILTIYIQLSKHPSPDPPIPPPDIPVESSSGPNLSQLGKEIRKNKEIQEKVIHNIKRLQELLPKDPGAGPAIEKAKKNLRQLQKEMAEMEQERQILLKKGSN